MSSSDSSVGPSSWPVGSCPSVEITLVQDDKRNLACASGPAAPSFARHRANEWSSTAGCLDLAGGEEIVEGVGDADVEQEDVQHVPPREPPGQRPHPGELVDMDGDESSVQRRQGCAIVPLGLGDAAHAREPPDGPRLVRARVHPVLRAQQPPQQLGILAHALCYSGELAVPDEAAPDARSSASSAIRSDGRGPAPWDAGSARGD